MAFGTLDSEWTKIMEVDRLSILATSISDRKIGMRVIILCLTLVMMSLLLPLLIFMMLLLRCCQWMKILKSILQVGLCLKTSLLPVMSTLCYLVSYITKMCLFCFSALHIPLLIKFLLLLPLDLLSLLMIQLFIKLLLPLDVLSLLMIQLFIKLLLPLDLLSLPMMQLFIMLPLLMSIISILPLQQLLLQ